MKIVNKKKFIMRILELLLSIAIIVLTILAINYANSLRASISYGGEYLIPVLGLILIYLESEKIERR